VRTLEVAYIASTSDLERGNIRAGASTEATAAKMAAANAKAGSSYLSMSGAGKKAAADLESSHNKMTSSLAGIGRSSNIAIAGLIGLGAAAYGIKKSVDTTAELAKETLLLHNVTGLNVESASEYAAVAQVQGLNVKGLNQAFGTLSKNVQAVTNAHEGLTHAASKQELAFRQLGLPLSSIIKAHGDMNKLLPEIIKRFEEMPGGIEKTNLGMTLFGRGWQTLVPLMHKGALGMHEQLEEAKAMGVTLGGSASQNAIKMAQAQDKLKYATLGLQVAVAQYLAPALGGLISTGAGVINTIRKMPAPLKDALEAVLGLAAGLTALVVATKSITAVRTAMGVLKGVFVSTAVTAEASSASMAGAVVAADGTIEAANVTAGASFTAMLGPIGVLGVAAAVLATHWKTTMKGLEEATEAAGNFIVDILNKVVDGFNSTIGKLTGDIGHLRHVGREGEVEPGEGQGEAGNYGNLSRLSQHELATGPGSHAASQADYLKKLGLPAVVAAGLAGNFAQEGVATDTGASGLGIGQWTGPRREALEAFARATHRQPTDEGAQLEFAAKELRGSYGSAYRAASHARSPREAAFILQEGYEKPEKGPTANQPHREQAAAEAGANLGYYESAAKHKTAAQHTAARVKAVEAASNAQIDSWAEHSIGKFAESSGPNRGPELDKLQAEFHTTAAAWCAEFATTAAMMGGANKAVRTASVATIREWAEQGSHGYQKGVSRTPQIGSLMMTGNSHVGFVQSVNRQAGTEVVIEGNANGSGGVVRRTRRISEGDYATPTYHKRGGQGGGVELQETEKGFAEAAKKALEHLLLSPAQQAQLHGFVAQAGVAHGMVEHYAERVTGAEGTLGASQARRLAGKQPLSSPVGAKAATENADEAVLVAKAEKGYYQHELAALNKEAKAWGKLRDSYGSFARHAHGNAKKEALEKAAKYKAKVEIAQKDARALGGSIESQETKIAEAEAAQAALPAEIAAAQAQAATERQGGDLSAYQAANQKIDMEARAELISPEQAKAAKEANAQRALAGGYGELSGEGRLQVLGDLKEFQKALTEATTALQDHTNAVLEATKAELAKA
jgi:surface antigen